MSVPGLRPRNWLAVTNVNGRPLPTPGRGLTLATIVLRGEQDVVAMCRRAREAGEEFALDPAQIRRLSAALFEVGRLLIIGPPLTHAEVTLADGPSLDVQFHVTDVVRLGGLTTLERGLTPLRAIVHRLKVVPSAGGAYVSVGVLFRSGLPGKTRAPSGSRERLTRQCPPRLARPPPLPASSRHSRGSTPNPAHRPPPMKRPPTTPFVRPFASSTTPTAAYSRSMPTSTTRASGCAWPKTSCGCCSRACPITRSACWIPTASSPAGTPVASGCSDTPPTKSSAAASRCSTWRLIATRGRRFRS